jgi:signal transduction histidine kinase
MPNRQVGGVTLRAVLLTGFGLTLGVWLLTGYYVAARLTARQDELSDVSARYVAGQDAVRAVRTEVVQASVVVRDALIDPERGEPAGYRAQVDRARATAQHLLDGYVALRGDASEKVELERLRGEVTAFFVAAERVLATEPANWGAQAHQLLQGVMPRRGSTIEASDRLQSENRNAYVAYQQDATAGHAALQRQVWTILGLALVVSCGIAWVAFRYATQLEARLNEQRLREEQISRDLQRLSARLVNVQEDERRRIARELHDEVGQALSAVGVELALAQQRLHRVGVSDDLLHDARVLADGVLRGVRDLSQVLHPSVLDDLGLTAALTSYVNAFGKRTRLSVDLVAEGLDVPADPDAERAVYRIVQEALTNVARHARATAVTVRLRGRPGSFTVVVEDDGVGFDAAAAQRPGRRNGLGLLGIRERVAQFGGRFVVDSVVERGTRLEVDLPVETRVVADQPTEETGAPIDAPEEVVHG